MPEENHQVEPGAARVSVVPLPIALYVSDGLIFELYDGGQPRRNFSIQWERFIPLKEKVSYESSCAGNSGAMPLTREKEETQLSAADSGDDGQSQNRSSDYIGLNDREEL